MTVEKTRLLFDKGQRLAEKGKYEEASCYFNRVLEIDPENIVVWCNKGNSLANLGRFEEAIACYDRAVNIDPKNIIVWCNKGNSLANLGRFEEAIACYDKALEIEPKFTVAWYSKGQSLTKLSRYEEAIATYNKVTLIDPNFTVAWYNQANVLSKLHRSEEAIVCYNKAIEISPKFSEAWNSKGNRLNEIGRLNESLDSYEKALEIDPKYASAWYNKGLILYKLGHFKESIRSLNKALAIKPDFKKAIEQKKLAESELCKSTQDTSIKSDLFQKNPALLYTQAIDLSKKNLFEEAFKTMKAAYETAKNERSKQYSNEQKDNADSLNITTTILSSTRKKFVRVALFQLNYAVYLPNSRTEFSIKLEEKNKEEVKNKIFYALEVASKKNADIVCFPELSVEEDWVNQAKEKYPDKIIVLGTYYRNGFNTCPIIIQNQVFYYQKIKPSPNFETNDLNNGMNTGNRITIFKTKCGNIAVLICKDFTDLVFDVINYCEKKKIHLDFLIVPSRNKAIDTFQNYGNLVCQKDGLPYVLIINSALFNRSVTGGTCIIGMDNDGALESFRAHGLSKEDKIKYKLFEAYDEEMIIATLNIKDKGARYPSTENGCNIRMCDRIKIE